MTFKKVQTKVKLCRTLKMISIFLVSAGMMMFIKLLMNFSLTSTNLALGAIAYVMSMAGSIGIMYSIKYTKDNTVCPKCGRQIHIMDFIYIKDFKCSHCEYECAAEEMW